MKKPLVTDLQKYCIHDGTGIRTTVFFKGCPLACTWCHNPETQTYTKQLLVNTEKCTGCGACIKACPTNSVVLRNGISETNRSSCHTCGFCLDYCDSNIRALTGTFYTVDELIQEIEKDKVFYDQSDGGVTLSGGEVLAQDMDYMEELLMKLHNKGYRVNIDTSGYAPFAVIERILPYVDTFLYDIKMMNPDLHKKYTGVDNELILKNLKQLSLKKACVWIRIPVIVGVNAAAHHMIQIADFLKAEQISFKQINLLPYHNTGRNKYNRLQLNYEGDCFNTPAQEELETFLAVFNKFNFTNVKIGG
ncbi:glycyl-radical enzyme activating protein [Anaerocolumna sp. MB42-C2]|uniref:glycyl-radical enzyme activating protein n=1 Tax=Anaerocolumna sp. MB42-C2 TaxID=3070997 RepID=UPI0027DF81B9|nr:glycyl-radical enzyme activating protein [Anaerocolumna sp. MB42-C2]WMJ88182.1 glycyl-radical enzyme activating protein [Anaerocolumna sp. MB42-C2]